MFRGAVRPPFIEDTEEYSSDYHGDWFRGAVRPPFIEDLTPRTIIFSSFSCFGGQSAPPSLKTVLRPQHHPLTAAFRGAVRPPFIEELP